MAGGKGIGAAPTRRGSGERDRAGLGRGFVGVRGTGTLCSDGRAHAQAGSSSAMAAALHGRRIIERHPTTVHIGRVPVSVPSGGHRPCEYPSSTPRVPLEYPSSNRRGDIGPCAVFSLFRSLDKLALQNKRPQHATCRARAGRLARLDRGVVVLEDDGLGRVERRERRHLEAKHEPPLGPLRRQSGRMNRRCVARAHSRTHARSRAHAHPRTHARSHARTLGRAYSTRAVGRACSTVRAIGRTPPTPCAVPGG